MYTANQNGQIAIESEDNSSGILGVKTTFHKNDPIPWRQWHQWNYNKNTGEISLKKGIQTFTK
jgi:hypothetical protein